MAETPQQFITKFEQRVERKKLEALKNKDEMVIAQLDAISKANTSIAPLRRKGAPHIKLISNEVSSLKSKTFALADSPVLSFVPINSQSYD